MFETENALKELIVERYGTARNFTSKIGMANSTLASILNRGIHNASIDNIVRICKELNISADALAQDQIVPNDWIEEKIDLVKMLTNFRMRTSAQEVTIAEDPVSENEKELVLDMLESIEKIIVRKHIREAKK